MEERIEKISSVIYGYLDGRCSWEDVFIDLLDNVVRYSIENNNTVTNYTARDLLNGVVGERMLNELFDE